MQKLLLAFVFSWVGYGTAQAQTGNVIVELEREAAQVIERVNHSVVGLRVEREQEKEPPMRTKAIMSPLTGGPFALRPNNYICSATVVDADGLLLTSHFNVDGKVTRIRAILPSGAEYDAQVLGYDKTLDVALLKIQASGLVPMKYADLKHLRQGQPVYALGRNPGGTTISFVAGVISALDRHVSTQVQADVRLNFSNSGGPLVDEKGRLIGIIGQISDKPLYASTFGQNSGVGFATTWDHIVKVLPELKAGAKVLERRKPFLGIQYSNVIVSGGGVTVDKVLANTSAARAGLLEGDVILKFDGINLSNSDDLNREIRRHRPGDIFKLMVRSHGAQKELEVKLGDAPEGN